MLIDSEKECGHYKCIKNATINSYMIFYASHLKWAYELGKIDRNPYIRISKLDLSDSEERDTFTIGDLNKIYASNALAEHVDSYNIKWIFRILNLTGARLGEICQLTVPNFYQDEEGRWFFKVTKDEVDGSKKRAKKDASYRIIPVNWQLIELGLIEFLRMKKSQYGDGLIFPLGRPGPDNKSDSWSNHYSREMNPIIKACNLVGVKVVHSFRHTFKDALSNADVSMDAIDRICGWKSAKELSAASNYGKGHTLGKLHEYVNRVRFEGVIW